MVSTQNSKAKFVVLLTGHIDTAEFFSSDDFYFKYSYVYGKDWEQTTGLEEGLSARCERNRAHSPVVIGLPIEATFASSNPFGWPQLLLSCYGTDAFGNDIVRGYGAVHLPTGPGRSSRRVAMFVPEASSTIQKFIGWITGKRPEFIDPRTVAAGTGRQVIRVRSQGFVNITMSAVVKDFKKFGYDASPSSMVQTSEYPLPMFDTEQRKPEIKVKEPLEQPQPSTSYSTETQEIEPKVLPPKRRTKQEKPPAVEESVEESSTDPQP